MIAGRQAIHEVFFGLKGLLDLSSNAAVWNNFGSSENFLAETGSSFGGSKFAMNIAKEGKRSRQWKKNANKEKTLRKKRYH
ncbi:hypothetical protein KIN20_035159 [Parelaphostrongylus tenuis]|uniref:Uncharacterized protein n=1 Tax=Parelaphostrongylus tenuis TaxID=148309 RepID=A0AAD5RB53_PARTN|nr:hypothetical protein KIN20_035159 [Parelaphostrongylus tenuis]